MVLCNLTCRIFEILPLLPDKKPAEEGFYSEYKKTAVPELPETACFSGQRGIRTLEALLTLTRFPVVRLRPAQPSVHDKKYKIQKENGASDGT